MKLPANVKLYLALGVVGLAVAFVAYRAAKGIAGSVKDFAATKLNPLSNENLIYDGVIGNTGRALTGDENFTLGGYTYELLHPGETFNNPDQPFCTNLLGIGCPKTPSVYDGVIDENDPTFLEN